MFYYFTKIFARLALLIFCKKLVIQNRNLLQSKGPLLIVANHPNSFLDAIIIGAFCKYPAHFLARGDAFTKPWHRYLLGLLNMIPIYRLSEGKENLHLNDYAFTKSNEVIRSGGVVLIFIEGICKNTHQLQPFKKGTARIAFAAWQQNIPLQVLPLTIQYNQLHGLGKQILIQTKNFLTINNFSITENESKNYTAFNEVIYQEFSSQLLQKINRASSSYAILFLPALLGKIIHLPLYYPLKQMIATKIKGTVFFDSILFGCLLILYPFYLLLAFFITTFFFTPLVSVGIVCIFPLLAWCTVQFKNN